MNEIQKTISKLSIEEKVLLTSGNSNWGFFKNDRLGLKELYCADGPHGLRAYKFNKDTSLFDPNTFAKTTLFPISAAMAATFSVELINSVGEAIGKECNFHGIDLLLAPGINMKRSPLGGRNFEYYSEDPYLTGECASAFVLGVQSTGVGACIKHYALNEQETLRRFINVEIDDLALFEYYLKPFKHVIKKVSPWAVMSSYNRVRKDYASESAFLIKKVLRNSFQFDGLVLSDWGGVQHKVKSLKNGTNLEMPGPSEFTEEVLEALDKGELTEQELDESLIPLFSFYNRVKDNKHKGIPIDYEKHHNLAYNVAKEAIVLLENNGILPLNKNQKIAVVGEFAKKPRINGGGSVSVLPYKTEIPLSALSEYFDVQYAPGYNENETNDELLYEVKQLVSNNEIIIFFTGTALSTDTEGNDGNSMSIPEGHLKILDALLMSNKKIIVVLNNGSSIDLSPMVGRVDAIIEAWLLGGANAKALVDIIVGNVNPSGRLSETFPLSIKHTPHYELFPGKQDTVYYYDDHLKNGYRYYDLHDIKVRYPFGYGLSYTTFEYVKMDLSSDKITDNQELIVHITLQNTGKIEGKETIQLYVSQLDGSYPKPVKELKGFRKISLKPFEQKTVSFILNKDAFSTFNIITFEELVESGWYKIMIGKNSRDIQLSKKVYISSKKQFPLPFSVEHPLSKVAEQRPEIFKELEEKYGKIYWYNKEEPIIRILQRYKKKYHWNEEMYQTWIKKCS
jgi:beta-glucosidase